MTSRARNLIGDRTWHLGSACLLFAATGLCSFLSSGVGIASAQSYLPSPNPGYVSPDPAQYIPLVTGEGYGVNSNSYDDPQVTSVSSNPHLDQNVGRLNTFAPSAPAQQVAASRFGPGNPGGWVRPEQGSATQQYFPESPYVPNREGYFEEESLSGVRPPETFFPDWLMSRLSPEVGPPSHEVEHFPRIAGFENDNPYSLGYTQLPNFMNVQIPDEWDFYRIIGTDRPDFTDSPFTVGEGMTFLETGYTFRRIESEDGIITNRRQLPEALLRHGVSKNLELRLRWNGYVVIDQSAPAQGLRRTSVGTDDLQAGLKYAFRDQDSWMPMITYAGMVVMPTGTNGMSADQVQLTQMVVTGWGLKRWLYIKNGFGVDFIKKSETSIGTDALGALAFTDHGDNETEWHESISLLYQLSKRFGGYTEWYCFFRDNAEDNRPDHYANTGLNVYLTPDIQLDVRIGTKISNRTDEYYTGMGLSARW